jgi:hypothetical protein
MDPETRLRIAHVYERHRGPWPKGLPLSGPKAADHMLFIGLVSEDEAALVAAMTDTDRADVQHVMRVRLWYRNRVTTIPAAGTVDVRLSIAQLVATGAAGHMFDDTPDPAATRAAAVASLQAPAWFVTADVCDFLDTASASMPDWVLSTDDLPDAGLVVFGSVSESPSIERGIDVPYWVNGVSYSLVAYGDEQTVRFEEWSAIAESEVGHTRFAAHWSGAGTHFWKVGTDVTDFSYVQPTGDNDRSGLVEQSSSLRRRMACLWSLAQTPRLLEQTELEVPRPDRRRAQRAGITTPVVLVDVRGTRREATDPQHTAVDWSHRWVVGGHWRSQPHGPGGQHRRPTWIAPHIKGPADKPLIGKERIGVVRADPATDPDDAR